MDKKLRILTDLADHCESSIPPERFIRMLGLKQAGASVATAAWNLFLETREIPTLQEAKALVQRRRQKALDRGKLGRCHSHFLDSGSFALWTHSAVYAKEHKTGRWAYYDTPEFFKYMDDYADFIKSNPHSIDHYSNLDVIPNAELSHRNLCLLRDKHGLDPVPVVHFTTDLKWLRKYIKEGCQFIALGGLVGSINKPECREWLDSAFRIICDTPNGLPLLKVHGFGIAALEAMRRYPWWSVDSSTWIQTGGRGAILVPQKTHGKFTFLKPANVVSCALESPDRRHAAGHHLFNLPRAERRVVEEWLEVVGVAMGENDSKGERVLFGIVNSFTERTLVNLRFFDLLCQSIQPWPWAFKTSNTARGRGLGLA